MIILPLLFNVTPASVCQSSIYLSMAVCCLLYVCLPVCQSSNPPVCLSDICLCLSVELPVYLSGCLLSDCLHVFLFDVCLPACMSIFFCMSFCLPFYLTACLSNCMYVCVFVFLFVFCQSLRLSSCLSFCLMTVCLLSTCMSFYL